MRRFVVRTTIIGPEALLIAPKGRRYRCYPARNAELYAFEVSPNEQDRVNGTNGPGPVSAELHSAKWSARHVFDEAERHSPPTWLVAFDRRRQACAVSSNRTAGRPGTIVEDNRATTEFSRAGTPIAMRHPLGHRRTHGRHFDGLRLQSAHCPQPDVSRSLAAKGRQRTSPSLPLLYSNKRLPYNCVREAAGRRGMDVCFSGQAAPAPREIANDTQWRRP